MTIYYYKSTDEKVYQEYKRYMQERDEWLLRCEEFTSNFNAKPLIAKDIDSLWLHGISFIDRDSVDLSVWTKPQVKNNFSSTLKVETKKNKVARDKILTLWNKKPEKYDRNFIFNIIGKEFSDFFFNSIEWHISDIHQCVFFKTSAIGLLGVTEITTTEYQQAVNEIKQANASGKILQS